MAKKYEIEVGLLTKLKTDTGSLQSEIGKIQQAFKKLDLGEATNKKLETLTNNLAKELGKFDAKIQKGNFANKSELTSFEKTASTISTLYKQLENEINNIDNDALKKLLPKNVSQQVNAVNDAFAKFVKVQNEGKKASSGLKKEVEKTSRILETASGKVKTKRNKVDEVYAALKLPSPKDIDKELKQVEQKLATTQGQLEAKKIRGRKEGTLVTGQNDRVLKSSTTEGAYALQVEVDSLKKRQVALKALKDAETAAATASTKHAAAIEAQSASTAETQKAFTELTNALAILKDDASYRTLEQTDENIESLTKKINKLNDQELATLKGSIPTEALKQMGDTLNQVEKETDEAASSFDTLASKEQEISQLKNSFMSFFSIANVVQLLKSAVRAAFDSIQELDKAMTETAVVTDFSVGDMWEQLPRYTKTANELGVTTLGAYETMTLFYQQGLDTNEAFELGTETMKMARIAGLDYAEATDKMTAALRGFNMELNTLSAQRVSDVYSELAAITAADTDEISTAMTKTASIANSANMEFETTAAFLSQIIETTRESAETAGTALKTVIARFQELKKDPAEIGEVDGEVVDANKIETALRSVGVALRDTNGQFRDLDDVFLELSEKWDTLDVNTQRYVATIAAGSRQQSRFIAMMSDYGRTVELVNAAYGSAGAAQKQYEKTLESWESKIAQLKNAWQEFVLGIVDSDFAKFIIDAGTTALNILNKLTEGVGGLSTTFLRLGVVIGGLKLGKVLLPALSSSLLDKSKPLGISLGKSIKEGLQVEFSGAGVKKIRDSIKAIFDNNKAESLFKIPTFNSKDIKELRAQRLALVRNNPFIEGTNTQINNEEISRLNKLLAVEEPLFKNKEAYLKATAQQQLAYNMAVQKGIAPTEAAVLLSKKDTAATYAELLATKDATEAEIKNDLATQSSILTKTQYVLATKIKAAAEAKGTAAKQKGTLANWAYTKSALAAKLAMLGMAAAAVAVVAGIVALIKHAKNNTLEKKMERAAEATKKAQEAANAAKDAYNELNNTLKSLNEHENELDTLIEGTDAWREKVAEINSEFTKLIDLYPDLQKFIEFDTEKGIYQWTDNGQAAQNYLESANIEMAERQYEVSNNRERERDLQLAKEISAFSFSAYVSTYGTIGEGGYQEGAVFETQTLNLTTDQAKQIASELSKFGGRASEDDLRNILENVLPTATQEMINALAKNSASLYALTDSINNQVVDTRPQAEAYIHTLLNTNDAYADIEDPNLKKYILATTTNKTKEEGFTEGKYKQDSEVINAYASRNRTDLNATYGAGQYNIAVKDDQIIVQALNGEVLRTIGTVEQVRKQLSIEDYVTGEVDVGAQTKQFNDEVAQVLTKIYGFSDVEQATPEQLNNVLQIVLTAAEKNIGFSADGDNDNYYATGFSGLSYQDLEALATDSDFVELVEKAIIAKQNSVRQTNENFNFDIETDADWREAGQDLDMSTEALELYTKEIEKNSAALQGNKNAAKLVAAEGLALKKAFSELEPIFEDSASALDNFGSPEYFKAIDKIAKALTNIAGLENITPEDITPDRLQLLTDAMNGSTDAFIRFRKEIALAKALKLDLPKKEIDYITNALNDLNGFNTEISASFDTSQIEAKMLELYNAGKITVAGLNEIFSGVGYKFKVEYTTEIAPYDGDINRLYLDKPPTIKVPHLRMVPIGETGTSNFSSSTNNSGGSGDSGNDYKADYDKHYNKMEDLAEEQRVRNDLEKEYNKLLRDNNTTISDITKNINAQIDSLKREREIQEFLYDARRQQIRDTMSEYSDLQGYASYNFTDNTIEIDYDAIKAITDEELGSRIDEYISKLEEFQDQMDEAYDALAEIDEAVQEIRDRGKEQFFDFEQKVLDAVVKSLEEEIESMNQVNDSINEANDELMNSINSTLERQRQEDENAEKEQELSDMQRRLDYLRQDTSGANLLEIKQLEKELGEAQDDYTDALIDQKISELEKQNDKAAEQREKQIAFAEAQLKAAQETGALWTKVHNLMTAGIGSSGIKVDSELWTTLTNAEGYASKSVLEGLKWGNELNEQVRQGLGWLRVGQDTESLLADNTLSAGQEISFKVGTNTLTGTLNADGTVSAEGNIYSGVFRNYDGNFMTDEEYKAPVVTPPAPNIPGSGDDFDLNIGSKVRVKKGHEWYYDSYGNGPTGWDSSTDRVVQISYAAPGNPYPYHVSDLDGGWLGWLKKEDLMAFKTGGLADFTGPAWLDGTKSRPELVLNQRDTQNFIQLRNVLAEATKSGFGKSENNEAVMFDIDINIDKVENEENVDALLTELERRINSYASYRNVTALTLKR